MPNHARQLGSSKLERILSLPIASEVQVVFTYHKTSRGFWVGDPIPDPSGPIATPKKRSPRE